MAGVKDKVVTVESLATLHEHNKESYMTKENPTGTGTISINRKADTDVGENSVAMGYSPIASGKNSVAIGYDPQATGENSVVIGRGSASGVDAIAIGYAAIATGKQSFATGVWTSAKGEGSFIEGGYGTSSGTYSHVEGVNGEASGDYSHVEGRLCKASGESAHAEGYHTMASSNYQHVQGQYNIEDADGVYAHIVGNGNSMTRSNAHTLDWSGNAWYAGDFSADGNMILSANQYGDTLPTAGTAGRIFFKKVTE